MMQAVILAGGLGTRLRPITLQIPKPMAPVGGAPYLQYQLRYLRRFGFSRALLLTGYLGDQVKNYFGDGAQLGMELQYSQEEIPLGTGGALRRACRSLDEEFCLIYGDSFLPVDYAVLHRAFHEQPALALIATCENATGAIPAANNVALDRELYVVRYQKRAAGKDLTYVEAGVHILRKQAVELLPPSGVVSLEEHLFPELARRRALRAYVSRERFYDIGTIEGLRAFEQSPWARELR
jgi:NDP-sugar pyrophosphorylase family protein